MAPWPVSVAFPLMLGCSIALMLAFDALGAWYATRNRRFDYRKLWPAQFGLYVVIGFVAMFAVLDLRRVEVIGAVTAFVEATLGWAITWRLGPGRVPQTAPLNIALVVVVMTTFGFGLSIAGALLFNLVLRALLHSAG